MLINGLHVPEPSELHELLPILGGSYVEMINRAPDVEDRRDLADDIARTFSPFLLEAPTIRCENARFRGPHIDNPERTGIYTGTIEGPARRFDVLEQHEHSDEVVEDETEPGKFVHSMEHLEQARLLKVRLIIALTIGAERVEFTGGGPSVRLHSKEPAEFNVDLTQTIEPYTLVA